MKDVNKALELANEVKDFWDKFYATASWDSLHLDKILDMQAKLERYRDFEISLSAHFERDHGFKITKDIRTLTAIFLLDSSKADNLRSGLRDLREIKEIEKRRAEWDALSSEEKEARSKATRELIEAETIRTGIPF